MGWKSGREMGVELDGARWEKKWDEGQAGFGLGEVIWFGYEESGWKVMGRVWGESSYTAGMRWVGLGSIV